MPCSAELALARAASLAAGPRTSPHLPPLHPTAGPHLGPGERRAVGAHRRQGLGRQGQGVPGLHRRSHQGARRPAQLGVLEARGGAALWFAGGCRQAAVQASKHAAPVGQRLTSPRPTIKPPQEREEAVGPELARAEEAMGAAQREARRLKERIDAIADRQFAAFSKCAALAAPRCCVVGLRLGWVGLSPTASSPPSPSALPCAGQLVGDGLGCEIPQQLPLLLGTRGVVCRPSIPVRSCLRPRPSRKAGVKSIREYEETHLAESQRLARERKDLATQVGGEGGWAGLRIQCGVALSWQADGRCRAPQRAGCTCVRVRARRIGRHLAPSSDPPPWPRRSPRCATSWSTCRPRAARAPTPWPPRRRSWSASGSTWKPRAPTRRGTPPRARPRRCAAALGASHAGRWGGMLAALRWTAAGLASFGLLHPAACACARCPLPAPTRPSPPLPDCPLLRSQHLNTRRRRLRRCRVSWRASARSWRAPRRRSRSSRTAWPSEQYS